jgi:hypothetical protein
VDPFTLSLISMGLNVGSGVLSQLLGSPDEGEAYKYRQEALAKYMGISVPELKEMVAKEQGDTHLKDVTTDPRFDAQQDMAAERLEEVGNAGGFDARARARMEQARMESAQAERSAREGVLASARARGTLGTGEELSAMVQAGQAAADRERMAGVQTQADAEERALQAIIEGGRFAGERQGRQWGQRAQVASAQDEIDRFNTATANDFTLANQQQKNIHFGQQMQLADGQAGALEGMAGHLEDRANHTKQVVGGIGQMLGYGMGAVGQAVGQGWGIPSGTSAGASATYYPGGGGGSAAMGPANAYGAPYRKVR